MHCLSIQIDTSRDQRYDADELIRRAKALGRYPEIDKDPNTPKYINLNFFTEDVDILWQQIRNNLLDTSDFGDWVKNTTIVVCENELTQDEAVVLWHYDGHIPLSE